MLWKFCLIAYFIRLVSTGKMMPTQKLEQKCLSFSSNVVDFFEWVGTPLFFEKRAGPGLETARSGAAEP